MLDCLFPRIPLKNRPVELYQQKRKGFPGCCQRFKAFKLAYFFQSIQGFLFSFFFFFKFYPLNHDGSVFGKRESLGGTMEMPFSLFSGLNNKYQNVIKYEGF